ncbi:MAG TPA: CHAD domain-containing protein [Trichocoleus sp.]
MAKVADQIAKQTLGSLAQAAIAKYLKQAVRYEQAVLADTDPEELHQMRVGMRRLRTAMQVFEPVIKLPKAAREPKVADVARQLGELRDLDVISETLHTQFLPHLPEPEQAALQSALEALGQHRRSVFKQVKQLIQGEKYRQLKKCLKAWGKEPRLSAIAPLPAATAMPDLVLPLISRLWLHPGWLVGTDETLQADTQIDAAAADELIAQNSETLHSLRKQIKRVRYQLKLVCDLYDNALDEVLDSLETMQETLGQLQDGAVMAEFLEAVIVNARCNMPTLFERLAEGRHQAWQQWQTLQTTYLDPQQRHHLRQILLTPTPAVDESSEAPTSEPASAQPDRTAPKPASDTAPADSTAGQPDKAVQHTRRKAAAARRASSAMGFKK